jgi:hypothetical protein
MPPRLPDQVGGAKLQQNHGRCPCYDRRGERHDVFRAAGPCGDLIRLHRPDTPGDDFALVRLPAIKLDERPAYKREQKAATYQ